MTAPIVFFTTPAMGHVKPQMPLVHGLVRRNQKVVCFGHKTFEQTIEAAGAEFRAYPDVRYDINSPDFNLVQMGADIIRASERLYPALLPQVEALSPRLIVQDFMALWASRIGTALRVPRIHTIPTIVFNHEAQRRMRGEDGLQKLAVDVFEGLPSLASALIASRFAVSIREAFALDGSWKRLSPPIVEIVFCIEALQVGETMGEVRRLYIGPTRNDHRRLEPAALRSGYALITFGTLSNNDIRRFEAAIKGAFLAGFSVVVQCGGKVDAARLRALCRSLEASHPGQWGEVIETVADLEALIVGAEVVVHHAGLATTWETIRFRKPALMIPTIADQKVLAGELERLGLGVRLPRGAELNADAIACGLRKLGSLACPWDDVDELLAIAGGAERGVQVILDALEELA